MPSGLIPPSLLGGINDLVGYLGYQPVDDTGGTPGRDADPRVPGGSRYFTQDEDEDEDETALADAPVEQEALLPEGGRRRGDGVTVAAA